MKEKYYFDGEAITAQGFNAKTFFLVKKGNVSVLSRNGKEIKRAYKSGEIFGLAEALVNAKWPFTTISRGVSCLYIYNANSLHSSLGELSPNYKEFIYELSNIAIYN